jgi:hypothetical protein
MSRSVASASALGILVLCLLVPASSAAPLATVTAARARPLSSSDVLVSWRNPSSTSFAATIIRVARGSKAPTAGTGRQVAKVSRNRHTFIVTGLSAGTRYTFALFATSRRGQRSLGALTSTTTGPAKVTGIDATYRSTTANIRWTNPSTQFDRVVVRFVEGTAPPKTVSVGVNAKLASPSADSVHLTKLKPDTTYSISVWTEIDATHNLSTAASKEFKTASADSSSKDFVTPRNIGILFIALLSLTLLTLLFFFVRQGWQGGQALLALPYMTWFLLHLVIGAIGIFAVVVLAVTKVIDGAGTSALLGSLFGYVLGSAKSTSSATGQAGDASGGKLQVKKFNPDTGPLSGGTQIIILGTGFPTDGTLPTVSFGEAAGVQTTVLDAATIIVVTPPHLAAGSVNVILSIGKTDVLCPGRFVYA